MKIWFDLSNSPHVNMFYDLIKELESDGNEIIITSRPLANTIQLLEQKGLKHKIIGTHYGKNIFRKIYGFPVRIMQLNRYLKSLGKIHIAVSQSSFHSPISAWLSGIPSIYTNDNEHAFGNKAAFLFASKILIPENLKIKSNLLNKFISGKVNNYPGIKEGIYLWKLGEKIHSIRNKNNNGYKNIYFRPEPRTAQYYNGKSNFLDDTIIALQTEYNFIILPRDSIQSEYYKNKKFHSVKIADSPIEFIKIATDCLLFIGAGGSMTRELAILGIPTISVYQDKLLEVDKVLISKGLMVHDNNLSAAKLNSYINDLSLKEMPSELVNKGKTAYQLFKKNILTYKND